MQIKLYNVRVGKTFVFFHCSPRRNVPWTLDWLKFDPLSMAQYPNSLNDVNIRPKQTNLVTLIHHPRQGEMVKQTIYDAVPLKINF